MKKVIFIVFILCTVYKSYGQIEYKDSARHVIVGGYAGVLAYSGINVSDKKVRGYVSARIGGHVVYSPKPFLTVFGYGAMEIDETAHVDPYFLVGAKFMPHKKISLTVGKIGTPMTELRPLPTTGAAQFETWTQARIPGSAYGGKISYSPSSKVTLVTGGFWRGNDASVELGIKVPYVRIAGYYTILSKGFGAAMTVDYKIISTVISYNHKTSIAMFNCITIPKTKGLMLCSDIGFDPVTGKMLRGEWGPFIPLNVWKVGMLFGTTYNHVAREVRAYFYIHL